MAEKELYENLYQEAKQFINIISKIRKDDQFYDMACKHQLNFLIGSLDEMKELLKHPDKKTKNICEALKYLGICQNSVGEFYSYPHFTYMCKKVDCPNAL